MIAATTSRIGLFPDVANLPLRPPALLAKAAASIDVLSGGRFELGLGAGGFWDAIEAYGGPRRSPGVALEALAEAIEVIRLLWNGGQQSHYGCYYTVENARVYTLPEKLPPITLAASGPKAAELAGRQGDGLISTAPWEREPPRRAHEPISLARLSRMMT